MKDRDHSNIAHLVWATRGWMLSATGLLPSDMRPRCQDQRSVLPTVHSEAHITHLHSELYQRPKTSIFPNIRRKNQQLVPGPLQNLFLRLLFRIGDWKGAWEEGKTNELHKRNRSNGLLLKQHLSWPQCTVYGEIHHDLISFITKMIGKHGERIHHRRGKQQDHNQLHTY